MNGMSKILFVDQNDDLIEKVILASVPCEVWCGDIFTCNGVIVSASNPFFLMNGGLDKQIKEHYPKTCALIDPNLGNQRINNVIFTVTVGQDYQATPELVREAIRFALEKVDENEKLLLSGLGTGIGGLDLDTFVQILKEELA